MRKVFALAMLVALTVGLLAPGMAHAQSGTPGTGDFGVPVGTVVPIIGQDGTQVGTISVSSITDPFDGFDPSYAPQRGYHYAVAEVTITNSGNRPVEFYPSSLMAIDSDNFVLSPAYLSFSDPSLTQLESIDALAPGESATGLVPFEVFGSATLDRVLYSPSYDRLITVVDTRTAPVGAGTLVSIMNTTGAEVAQVTVNGITDPFEGYDSFSSPSRGNRYVMLDVTVTNTGASVLSTSPSDFYLTDAEGFVLSTSYVSREDATALPDFDWLDLNPGESQQGAIVYEVYEGIPLANVSFGDGYTTLAVVADLGGDAGVSTGSETTGAVPAATEAPAVGTEVAPALATEVPQASATGGDCDGLVEWGIDLVDRISSAGALTEQLQGVDTTTVDPAIVRELATQLRALGDDQAASNPPPAAVELNTLMTEQFYYALADAVDQIATALEEGNAAGAIAGQMSAQSVIQLFEDGGAYDQAADALTLACPAEIQQLDEQAG
ncbi:MAG: DUF4352 domain-containing protein [Thermomicrobiales bacterium]|nr:DUF4352 domain-containing protein [Thermomicrobiales bacterium]MCO5222965.1 DUF4352 domain-containing protein [Thermomicrobiales bacterium]